ncbi:MAG: hypothetical protein ACFHVJ_06225 [Aestuariibacter sp.]
MYKTVVAFSVSLLLLGGAQASVDSDFKPIPQERFSIYTGDGNYKQVYHWEFNSEGTGPAVTVFLNHGSGGEWYDEIETEFSLCGPDYINENGDFTGSEYEGLCQLSEQGERLFLADFNQYHVPVGPELERFMLKKIVGSSKFAAWYWQDAFRQFDSPVHVFMVGRYNISKDPEHLNNALFWLNVTEQQSVSRETLPPYNFDGYGVKDIDGDDRPFHAAPDISGFDNMFLYKAVKQRFPSVSLNNLIIEGRSNGGSAMFALSADYKIWPQHIRDFWGRNLNTSPVPPSEPDAPTATADLEAIMAEPALADAFNLMLSQYSMQDLLSQLEQGKSFGLMADGIEIQPETSGSGDYYYSDNEVEFDDNTFAAQLTEMLGGDFYQDAKLVHGFYPGCRLDALMQLDSNMSEGELNHNGDSVLGYQVALPTMFSFASEDSIYTYWCDDRIAQAQNNNSAPVLNDLTVPIDGQVFNGVDHGFDYKDVYRNLEKHSAQQQLRSQQARQAIERVVNQAIKQAGLEGQYQLPYDLD